MAEVALHFIGYGKYGVDKKWLLEKRYIVRIDVDGD